MVPAARLPAASGLRGRVGPAARLQRRRTSVGRRGPGRVRQGLRGRVRPHRPPHRLPARPRAERRRRTDGEGARRVPVLQGHPRQHRRQAVGEGLSRCGLAAALTGVGLAVALAAPPRGARPSDPGVVNYAVLGKGSVGNIVGAPMAWESTFTDPFQAFCVDNPVCNNWADIGLPEVYADPDLASFNGAVDAGVGDRRDPPGQAGRRGVRHQRRRRPGVPPRRRPNRRLLGPDHRDAPGQLATRRCGRSPAARRRPPTRTG